MTGQNLTRLTMGLVILIGLIFFRPLAYFVAVMMIFAGLTGICLLERFFSGICGMGGSCSLKTARENKK